MKKAFDANVSRAKPRVRLGALMTEPVAEASPVVDVESLARQVAQEPVIPSVVPAASLGSALKARAQANQARPTAVEALAEAIRAPLVAEPPAAAVPLARVELPVAAPALVEALAPAARAETFVAPAPARVEAPVEAPAPVARLETPMASAARVVAAAEPPPATTEVQTAPVPHPDPEFTAIDRRERLRERLKAVRENPRPEPLPDTVAEAGVLAVERISALQTELAKSRALTLALTQDLEAARRQAERATEEARLRMDEAKRLSAEMEGRVTLLSELERELESLEGERNEALLALQESRQLVEARETEKLELLDVVAKKDAEIADCLAEEERLASELEGAQETMTSLRRSGDALKSERDTLARQVSELTRERAELLEARKALEAVHRALSTAARR